MVILSWLSAEQQKIHNYKSAASSLCPFVFFLFFLKLNTKCSAHNWRLQSFISGEMHFSAIIYHNKEKLVSECSVILKDPFAVT